MVSELYYTLFCRFPRWSQWPLLVCKSPYHFCNFPKEILQWKTAIKMSITSCSSKKSAQRQEWQRSREKLRMRKLEFETVAWSLRTVDNEFCKFRIMWENITEKSLVPRTLRPEDCLIWLHGWQAREWRSIAAPAPKPL